MGVWLSTNVRSPAGKHANGRGWGVWLRCPVSLSVVSPVFVYLSLSFPCRVELNRSFPTSPSLGYPSVPCKPIPGNCVLLSRILTSSPRCTCCLKHDFNDPVRPVFPFTLCVPLLSCPRSWSCPSFSCQFQRPVKNKLFATVPGSSINSWDSWFICMTYLVHGKR
jgi:hypothetical protein